MFFPVLIFRSYKCYCFLFSTSNLQITYFEPCISDYSTTICICASLRININYLFPFSSIPTEILNLYTGLTCSYVLFFSLFHIFFLVLLNVFFLLNFSFCSCIAFLIVLLICVLLQLFNCARRKYVNKFIWCMIYLCNFTFCFSITFTTDDIAPKVTNQSKIYPLILGLLDFPYFSPNFC